MEDKELELLLKELEADRVERKRSLSDKGDIYKCICAFANDLPDHQETGILFIGVNDNGTCAHLPITDRLLLELADMRSDGNVTPFPALTVQKKVFNEYEVAVVTVEPSYAPPVRFKGRAYVRVGPSTRVATEEDERRLTEKRRAGDLPYDIQPVSSAIIDDLDLDMFRDVYLPSAFLNEHLDFNNRPVHQQLASLRFTTVDPEPVPTVLGILVVGKVPRDFIPGAYVQFLRIDGAEITDSIKDRREIDGPLPELLRMLDEAFRAHVSIATDVTTQSIEGRYPEYPIVAFQQLARNAVLHRIYDGTHAPTRITWFNDRIEIQSPGGPFGQVSRHNFAQPHITDYRNPHLAEAMKNLGFVQKFGLGIPLAKEEMEKNGNPPLVFNVEDTYVLVVMRKRP